MIIKFKNGNSSIWINLNNISRWEPTSDNIIKFTTINDTNISIHFANMTLRLNALMAIESGIEYNSSLITIYNDK